MSSISATARDERTNKWLLIGAAVLAIVTGVLIFAALANFGSNGKKNDNNVTSTSVNVITAAQDIEAGTKITADMLDVATLPKAAAIEGSYIDKASVIGLTALYPVVKGEQFSFAKVVGARGDQKVPFSYVVPQGKRATAVQVQENSSVGGLIVAGDRVDIVAVAKLEKVPGVNQQDDRSAARIILQNIEVLAVAQTAQKPIARTDAEGNPNTSGDANGALAARPDNIDAKPEARTVTLAIDPKDLPALALAQDGGKVYLAARAPGDNTITDAPLIIGLPTNNQ